MKTAIIIIINWFYGLSPGPASSEYKFTIDYNEPGKKRRGIKQDKRRLWEGIAQVMCEQKGQGLKFKR